MQEQKNELLALESIYSDRPECLVYNIVEREKEFHVSGSIVIRLPELEKPLTVEKSGIKTYPFKKPFYQCKFAKMN